MQVQRLHIDEPRTPDQALQRVAQTAQKFFSADVCIISAVNQITRDYMPPSVVAQEALRDGALSLDPARLEAQNQQVIEQGLMIVENLAERQDGHQIFTSNSQIQTLAAIPLRTDRYHKLMAVLYLLFRQPRTFMPHETEQLSLFAGAASSVLQNFWLLYRYQEVARAGDDINQDLTTIDALFQKLGAHISRIIGSHYFLLGVHQPQQPPTNCLDLYTLEDDDVQVQREQPLRGGSAWVLRTQQPLPIRHLSQQINELPTELVPMPGKREELPESVIFVPLSFRKVPQGVLSVQHHQPEFYDADDLQILSLLGNHVALALSNIRLFESMRQLNETGQMLTQRLASEDEDVLKSVVDRIRTATKADIVTLFPYSRLNSELGLECYPYMSGTLKVPNHPRDNPSRQDDIAVLTLGQAESVFAKDSQALYTQLGGNPQNRRGNFEQREEIRSTAAVPLRVSDDPIGALFINFRQPQRFDETQKQLISGLASYAAIAIRNSREFDRQKRRRELELELIQQIDREIRKSLSLEQVMQSILEQTFQHLRRADEASIALFNARTERLEAKAAIGRNADHRRELIAHWYQNKGITRWVFEHKQPVRVDNVRTDPRWADTYVLVAEDILAELDVPLLDGDEVLGVINFESTQEAAFTRDDERFLMILADQAVLALQSAQAYKKVRTLHEVDLRIIEQLDSLDSVMQVILGYMLASTPADIAEIHLFENSVISTIYVARQPELLDQPSFERQDLSDPQPPQDKEGIIMHVARTRQPYLTQGDAQADDYYIGDPNVHSEIAYPLLSGNELIGVLNLEGYRQNVFDEQDLDTLGMFAGQAVIAVQNARNYAQANIERQRFQSLYRVGRDLAAITDISQLPHAYDMVLQSAEARFGSQAVVRRYDEEHHELVLERAARSNGVPPFERMSIEEGINGWVARHRVMRVVHDVLGPDDLDARPSDPKTRSLVVTPILFRERYYGNLGLSHERPGYFSDADLKLLNGLSQQLAMTIYRLETVQAHQLSEQRAKEAELMGSIGQASMEITHRLGNDLGLIKPQVKRIRHALHAHGVADAKIEEDLDKILQSVGKVLDMSGLLKQNFAEYQHGKPLFEPVVVPMHALLEEAIQGLPQVPRSVTIRKDIPTDLAQVRVVTSQIADIVTNLVGNAVEAMPSGGTITLRARNVGQNVLLQVSDTGMGIAASALPYIYNILYSTRGSTGFGLWSARRNALANGGDLTVVSEPGRGTTFTLSLPRYDQPQGGAL